MTTQELKQYIDKVLGNNIRCLLPSYWWKRLFTSLADRVDEVEQSTTQLIESKVEEVKMPIVESVDELSKLNLPKGSVAAVKDLVCSFKDLYRLTEEDFDNIVSSIKKLSRIERIAVKPHVGVPKDFSSCMCALIARSLRPLMTFIVESQGDTLQVSYFDTTNSEAGLIKLHNADGSINKEAEEQLNSILKEKEYLFVGNPNGPTTDEEYEVLDSLFTIWEDSELYIKGASWERLAKESDLGGNEGGNGEDKTLTFYAPIGDVSLSDAEKQHNAESYQKVAEGFESDKYYDIKVLLSTFQLVALDVIKTINPANDNGRLKLIFGGVGSGIDLQKLTVTSDGSATITIEGIEESGVELRDLYIYENYDGTLTELTEEQKAWNVETLELAKQGKAIVRTTLHGYTFILELFNEDNEYQFGYTQFSPSGGVAIYVYVAEDGLSGIKIEESHFDSELSTTSTNAVQNKVITAALNNKVDKVNGKQLSTEDFTTALKTKLEGLSNYDDTSIQNAVNSLTTQIDTLVSGDASAAIESFNEIIAFLNGVEDSESLDSIIASIEQQIAAKQDKLVSGTNIKTINGESILGEGNIVVDIDTSGLASQLASKQDIISDLSTIRSNASLGATAIQKVKTINSVSLSGEGNIELHMSEIHKKLQDIKTVVLNNEEVLAAALNDINRRLLELENLSN